ncbi:sulfite exporter TauE/SafE family protein [Granulicella sp. WH15]|uniref:sulfite exporter TauE/SafE family protein n=1 Tax=Granulicella sp. WH15 TaxID=2602070 RepID=UPI001366A23D|nr:sulfite exporter TauE/SafE family protein [Granulicella sp. WH15]QHN02052.1 sulfite exporter TauE/SafE family protein [Granulicella sp. WH15]
MLSALTMNWHYLWLVAASFIAGVMNAMAGGGSFVAFPAMLGVGVPPIQANATNTVALWPGQLTSLAALRGDVRRDLMPVVALASITGGIAGAMVLLHTKQVTFMHLIPWLLLTGAVLFGISGPVSKWLRNRSKKSELEHHHDARISPIPLFLGLLPICFYVGYFGAGGGFLIMTVLALFGIEEMHTLNAMKVVAACLSNLCAIFTFIAKGAILWHYCLVAMVFAAAGGYIGARYTRRMNPAVLRAVVVVIGVAMAVYFFWKEA